MLTSISALELEAEGSSRARVSGGPPRGGRARSADVGHRRRMASNTESGKRVKRVAVRRAIEALDELALTVQQVAAARRGST